MSAPPLRHHNTFSFSFSFSSVGKTSGSLGGDNGVIKIQEMYEGLDEGLVVCAGSTGRNVNAEYTNILGSESTSPHNFTPGRDKASLRPEPTPSQKATNIHEKGLNPR